MELGREGDAWEMRRRNGTGPFASSDPDTARIWWADVGVHQNMTFPVQPDPVSGAHCWHQAVRIRRAAPEERHGDIWVDTAKAHRVFREWLEMARPARDHSPDGTRRPYWLLRPVRPERAAFRLPAEGSAAAVGGEPGATAPEDGHAGAEDGRTGAEG